MRWRYVVTPKLHPCLNMALDEVLLDAVRPGCPTLRLYSWHPPAVSLGHFQRILSGVAAEWKARGFLLVRRITGGGAIVHKDDFTYSIVLADLSDLGLRHHTELYQLMNRVFALTLWRFGVRARPRGGAEGQRARLAFFCSERPSPYDLLVSGRKILGSAQRCRGRAILQHGSILLSANDADALQLSVSEAARRQVTFEEFARALCASASVCLGVELIPGAFQPQELDKAKRVAEEKYANESDWNT